MIVLEERCCMLTQVWYCTQTEKATVATYTVREFVVQAELCRQRLPGVVGSSWCHARHGCEISRCSRIDRSVCGRQ